jgi:hypothetical protein
MNATYFHADRKLSVASIRKCSPRLHFESGPAPKQSPLGGLPAMEALAQRFAEPRVSPLARGGHWADQTQCGEWRRKPTGASLAVFGVLF